MSSIEIGASRPVGALRSSSAPPAAQAPFATTPASSPAQTPATVPVETSMTASAGSVPVDQNRVAEIRKAVENGTYPMIPTKITDAMIAAGVMLQKAR